MENKSLIFMNGILVIGQIKCEYIIEGMQLIKYLLS
jgi:hypothetical protein